VRRISLLFLLCATLAMAAVPADAAAQHRRGTRIARPVVRVGGYYRPYYRPVFLGSYFYRPYFYDPFVWGFYGWYPYGPLPPYAYYPRYYADASSVRIQVKPREAEVYLDGYFVGRVDDFDGFSQRLTVPPGEHALEIYLDGYRTIREKRLFLPRTNYTIKDTMQKAAEGQPPDVRPTPKEGAPPPGGPGQPGQRNEPPSGRGRGPQSEFGSLRLRAQPPDATVLVDGQEWERPAGGDTLVIELAPGMHRVEVRKDGLEAFAKDVEIRAGETTPLNVSLLGQ
jgi:hypothetical protein